MRRWLAFAVLSCAGCSPVLEVPSTVDVVCENDGDCIDGGSCAPTGFCVAELSGVPLALRAATALSNTEVELIFDQDLVLDAALDAERYIITPALAVLDAFSNGPANIVLRTDEQALAETYTVQANDLVGSGGTFLDPEASSATFLGFGIPADTTAPEPISPAGDMLVVGLSQTLVWTPRVGAGSYTVTVATDAECDVPVTTVVVPAVRSSVDVVLPSTGRFFWCVSADVTAGGARGEAVFHATDDAIYVYCANGDDCQDERGEVGSPDAPLRSVQRAVSLAQGRGLTVVRIAARGGGNAYDEVVQIRGAGVDLDGGYDPTFTTHAPATYSTTVRFVSSALIISELVSALVIRGLRFEADTTRATIAVFIDAAPALITFRDAGIRAVGATPLGLAISGAGDVLLERCDISTSDSEATAAIGADFGTSLRIVDSTVLAGNALVSSDGIVANGSLDISGSVVMSGDATEVYSRAIVSGDVLGVHDSRVVARAAPATIAIDMVNGIVEHSFVYAQGAAGGTGVRVTGTPTLLRGNVIVAVAGGAQSAGIAIDEGPTNCSAGATVRVVSNTVFAGNIGLLMRAGSPIVTNNLLFAPLCVAEIPVTSRDTIDPLSFENNAMVHCATAYRELRALPGDPGSSTVQHTSVGTLNAIDGGACLEETGTAVRYRGNVVADYDSAQVFVDLDGADSLFLESGDASTYESLDNDLSLLLLVDPLNLATAGKDATTSTCGNGTMPCDGEAVDLAGNPRTPPWSVGAYEHDAD